ncbi:MAG: DUF4398 domain-containing protein [Proteobacteria bacterium]|nr:DUF4398 domain-containing protein [Pseudomonadota bacterium]
MKAKKHIVITTAFSVILSLLIIGGCGTTGTPPTNEIANTEMNIKQAVESDANKYAPLELRLAEDNLKAAKAAMANEEYEKAQELADKALADATLARAKSNEAKAKKFAGELQESIKSLQSEINRMQSK